MWEKAIETAAPLPQAIVSGLTEGNEYQFRVIAVNKAGQSEPSKASKNFIAKPRFCKWNNQTNQTFFLRFLFLIKTKITNSFLIFSFHTYWIFQIVSTSAFKDRLKKEDRPDKSILDFLFTILFLVMCK